MREDGSMVIHHGSLSVSTTSNADYVSAKRYLCRDRLERCVFAKLEHQAAQTHLRINSHNNDSYDSITHTLHWDPSSALRTTQGGRQSPALGLGHEADHATMNRAGLIRGWNHPDRGYDDAEERRVICGSEAHAARTLGESRRHNHLGSCYRVAGPTDR